MEDVRVYTDGSCIPNPGDGGWAVISEIPEGEHCVFYREMSGYESNTTNNRMELTAVIKALENIRGNPNSPVKISVYLDSDYVRKGITEWISDWKKKKWKNVKNVDLWKQLDSIVQRDYLDISWNWVAGHSGHIENERCDILAKCAIKQKKGTNN
jgi:ribonuclease HI